MKKFCLFAYLLLTYPLIYSQITFERTYGDIDSEHGLSIQQVSDSSYIITGYVETGALSWNFLLFKIDAYGDTIWVKEYAGNPSDAGYSVKNTPEYGGFIIVGCRYCAFATRKVYMVKADAQGRIRWAKQYDPNDDQIANDVVLTPVNNFVVTGAIEVNYQGLDIYLFETDRNGNMLWSKSYGLNGVDIGYSLCKTNDNGYVITGRTESYAIGSSDAFALKVNDTGVPQWIRTFGGTDYDEGRSVIKTEDGGFIIAGYTSSFGHGNADVFVVRTDENGDTLWTRTYGGTAMDRGYSIKETTDGGYIITGVTASFGEGAYDVYLIKTDEMGDTVWTKTFGGYDYDQGFSVIQTMDGGFIIAGVSSSFTMIYYDVYIIKLDEEGMITWTKEIPLEHGLQPEIHPNPFIFSTSIDYSLPESGPVLLEVYDLAAKKVAVLVNEFQENGNHHVLFNGESLAPGIYFYRLKANCTVMTGKLVLNR